MFTLQDLTVYDAFARARNAYPDNDALTYLNEKWTYTELDRSVNAFAKRFFNIGIKPGMHVGLWCDNTPNFVFSVLALSKMGAVLVLFNTSLHRVEMQKLIAHTDTELLLVGDGYKDIDFRKEAKGLKEKVECLNSVIYIGESRDSKDLPDLFNFAPGSELLLDKMHDSVNAHDDGYILFTSGTTDAPRVVLGSHIARANMGLLQGKDLETKPSDRFCVTMPMFHCFCFSVNFEAALFYGACLCLPKSRHAYDILSTAEKERCTVLSAVPSLFHTIISKYNPDDYNLSSLRAGFIGGGVCSASLFTETEEKLGLTLLSSLGQTEATAAVTTSSLSDSQSIRSSTVGHFIDSVSFRFGDNGEICIKGFNVMKGYYNDPYGTSRTIDENGWLHTGDRGYITEEKNLVLTGRVKDIIIRGGENISPLEIESVLDGDKRIACCKAVGVPDVHYGEEAALCVIQNENAGKPITEEQIRRKLRTSLASYKVPKYILFMDEFPKTDSGKIKTLELKRNVIDLLNSSHD